jgi:hypothetical protein
MATKKKPSKRPVKKLVRPAPKNKILLLLDSSGSMASIAKPAVDAFNRIIESIRAASFATGQETSVTLYTFGERSAVSCKFFDVPIAEIKRLNDLTYRPEGQTPLCDCVGDAITAAKELDDRNVSFVLNVITDGEENYSSRYNASSIQALIKKVQATDWWTVTFTVPSGAKNSVVQRFGLHDGNVTEWEASAAGAARVADSFANSYRGYFTARSRGATKSDGFFVTDMSKVKTSTVKKQLTDVKRDYAVLHVRAEAEIRPFVEAAGYAYVLGNAFYQLSKNEEIQPYKEILLREKGKTIIYGGAEARELLSFPPNLTVKVKPGNHANWDIFIQSTSVNRKLVRGTDVLYRR